MKLSLLSLLATGLCAVNAANVRLQHWNLRFDSKKDGVSIDDTLSSLKSELPDDTTVDWYKTSSEQSWSKRRIGVANDVLFNRADILTVNEALENQVKDLKTLLTKLGDGDQWDYIGVGRDDGVAGGEFQAIFYNTAKVSLESNYTIWLSDTPFQPSKYPGAGSYRSTTVGHFKINGSPFTLINTHLDDRSDDQRKLGASLLRYLGAYEYINSDGPVFLTGDFNSHVAGSDSGGYKITVGSQALEKIDSKFSEKYASSISDTFAWGDFLTNTEPSRRSGHLATFNGFKPYGDTSGLDTGRIDFQFAGVPNSNSKDVPQKFYKVLRHRVGEVFYDNEWYLSDHRPLISDVQF